MKIRSMIILTVCVLPALSPAEGPATRPLDKTQGYPSSMKGERRGPWSGAMREKPTPAEMKETEQFLRDELPNRYELFSHLPADRPMRGRLLELMAVKYRMVLRMKDQDPEMYEQLLREAKLEDEAIQIVRDIRDNKEGAEARLHEKAAELVQSWLDGRKARIERLEEALKKQREAYAYDVERKDERIDEKAGQLQKEFSRLFDGIKHRREMAPEKPVGQGEPEGSEATAGR